MRPDISKLISPLYPKLDNHPHVTTYPNVMGVAENVYLVSHTVEEEKVSNLFNCLSSLSLLYSFPCFPPFHFLSSFPHYPCHSVLFFLRFYCLCFFILQFYTLQDNETNSKSNTHEALLLARLCEYLLLQGYKPEQITVLTPYCGQVYSHPLLLSPSSCSLSVLYAHSLLALVPLSRSSPCYSVAVSLAHSPCHLLTCPLPSPLLTLK
jgi:hypothetical protein